MSKRSTIWSAGLALVLITGLVVSQWALAASQPEARVTYLKGRVFVQRSGGAYTPLQKDATLKAGDLIKTEKKSRIEIRLADNSVIRLGSRSSLTLEKSLFSAGGDHKEVSGKLWQGKAYAVVSKLVGEKSSFEVRTGTAVAGVRGTAFRIDARKDKSTVVRVYTGAVAVSNAPIYAKPGKPGGSGSGGAFQMPRQGVKPGGPGRVEVAGPHEVTKKQWEEFVAKAMQEVRVSGTGKMSAPVAFNAEQDAADEWVAWNKSMDKQMQR